MILEQSDLFNIKEASIWASDFLGKNVTPSNISYLIQYGRIKKVEKEKTILISKAELIKYYKSYSGSRENTWKEQLGTDLNWNLSFDQYKESETTKHVHRLHPYKGKFIPQLVEYFLNNQTDNFKKQALFQKGDIILDPFCGSGTTLVQSSELGMHAIGVDISEFNALISNCKIVRYDLSDIQTEINRITTRLKEYLNHSKTTVFEEELMHKLYSFNNRYFPVPDYKYRLRQGLINEEQYGYEYENKFLPIYNDLLLKYDIHIKQKENNSFLSKWYLQQVRDEIEIVFEEIQKIENIKTQKIMSLILSRTMRSCRATTHSDLATLKEPITATYYCSKHGKICKPLFSILKWWESYSRDTIKRIVQFDKLRTETYQICLTGDSRTINIPQALEMVEPPFAELIKNQKIRGIFSSPPYVGLIDYHEQHAYAYDLFGFKRQDESEIGPLFRGQGKEARESYITGISDVLTNCKKFFIEDYDVFLVANDKYNMYPTIAEKAGMEIVNQFKRPVLNRTEKDKGAYSEIIFHLKEKSCH